MCLWGFMNFDLPKWPTIGHNYLQMPDIWKRFVSGADIRSPSGDLFHIAHTHLSGGIDMCILGSVEILPT